MRWELAAQIKDPDTVEGKLFPRLKRLEEIRKREKAFVCDADTWTIETWEASVLCIGRHYEGETIIGLFNFSEFDKTAWIDEGGEEYEELFTGAHMQPRGVNIPAYGFYYLKKKS